MPLEIVGKKNNYYDVLLDGKLIGYVSDTNVQNLVQSLRVLKIEGNVVSVFTFNCTFKKKTAATLFEYTIIIMIMITRFTHK